MGLFTKIFGTRSQREIRQIQPTVDKILGMEDAYKHLSEAELKAKTAEFKDRLAKGETLDDLLPEAFATVREAADRVLGLRPYPVQLMGGKGYMKEGCVEKCFRDIKAYCIFEGTNQIQKMVISGAVLSGQGH